jgi:molybdopterin/thiamine biosynthesis adenylyltransferase
MDVLKVLGREGLLAAPSFHADMARLSATGGERYSRQLGLLEELAREAGRSVSGLALQAALRSATVVVIGTGGLGSWVLVSLAAAGVAHLVVCDGDRVELSNLNRQILFGTSDIGRLKTEVVADCLRALDSTTRVDPVNMRIGAPDDVTSLSGEADLVIKERKCRCLRRRPSSAQPRTRRRRPSGRVRLPHARPPLA